MSIIDKTPPTIQLSLYFCAVSSHVCQFDRRVRMERENCDPVIQMGICYIGGMVARQCRWIFVSSSHRSLRVSFSTHHSGESKSSALSRFFGGRCTNLGLQHDAFIASTTLVIRNFSAEISRGSCLLSLFETEMPHHFSSRESDGRGQGRTVRKKQVKFL